MRIAFISKWFANMVETYRKLPLKQLATVYLQSIYCHRQYLCLQVY